MADDLIISVGGDLSSLEASLDDIPAVAQESAAKIQAAFDAIPSATEGAETGLANLSTALQESGAAAGEAAGHIETIPPALHDTEAAAGEAGDMLKEFIKTGLELAGIEITFEAIKEAVTEMVSAFENVQRAEISLTALSGSAEQAVTTVNQLKDLAVGEGLSFPALLTAQQRMQAFGISTNQIPALLQAAANAAAVMNKDIESAVNVLDRMAVSGMAGARQLTQLGLTTHDLATAMGVADDAVQKAFKALDQSDRVQVLITALEKFHGVAADLADTLTGRWQSFKTSMELATEGIGEAIATGLTSTIQTAQASVVPGVQAMVEAFKGLADLFGGPIMGTINSLTQGFGDLLTVIGATASLVIKGTTQAADDFKVSLKDLWDITTDLTPWHLFQDSIHNVATEIQLFSAGEQIASKAAEDMASKFTSVTASLKATIDGQFSLNTKIRDTQIAWSEAEETVTQAYAKQVTAVTEAQKWLDLITKMYQDGRANVTQYQQAVDALRTAQDALNGGLSSSVLSLQQVTHEYSNLQQALNIANRNLDLVSQAYLNNKASLAQYEAAVNSLKSAQDALNGTLEKTPLQQVEDEFNKLNTNLAEAQDHLKTVVDAMNAGKAGWGQYQSAVAAVNSAQQALTGSTTSSTAAIDSSGPKIIDVAKALSNQLAPAYQTVAAAASSAAAAQAGFVGPIQDVSNKIEMYNGNVATAASGTNQMINGVQVLTGSLPNASSALDTTATKVLGLSDNFNAASTQGDQFDQMLQNVAAAATDAASAVDSTASAVGSLGSELDSAMAGPSEGGGMLGTHVNLKPGDLIMAPSEFFTPPIPGGTETGSPTGGLFGPTGPTEQVTAGTPQELIDLAQQRAAAVRQQQQAAQNLTVAASNLTDAATLQQSAAQTAYDAAKAATVGAQTTTTALTTAADSISASVLAAADAANAAAFNASTIGSQVMDTLTSATNTVAAATALVGATIAAVGPAVGLTSGTNALVASLPTAIAPITSGPSGSNTLVIPMPTGSGPWDPTVGGGARLQLVLNNSGPIVGPGGIDQLVSILGDNLVKQLQTQGIRLTRA